MKFLIAIILTASVTALYSQPATNDDYVQNFYVTCKSGKYSAYQDIQVGVQLLDTKQYSRSINRFTKALSKDSTCKDAYYMLAFCYQQTGKLPESIAYADSAIAGNPSSPSAWIIKGTSLLMSGDSVHSEECFKKAIEGAPDKLDGYYGLALTYFRQKRMQESAEVIARFEALGTKPTVNRDGKKLGRLKELVR